MTAVPETNPGAARVFVLGIGGPYSSGKSTLTDALVKAGAFQIDVDKLGHAALEDSREQVIARFGAGIVADAQPPTAGERGTPDSIPAPIDRKALGRIVFSDPQALRDLEAITHPAMVRRVSETISARVAELGGELSSRTRGALQSADRLPSAGGESSSGESSHPGDGHLMSALQATRRGEPIPDAAGPGAAPADAASFRPFSIKNLIVINAALLFKMKLDPLCDLSLWVDAPQIARLVRGLRRDKLGLKATWRRIRSQRSIWPQLNGANADIQKVQNLRRVSSLRKLAAILRGRGLKTEDAALLE